MNIVTLASRRAGVGKSTLTAHLAAAAQQSGFRCLLVDADPAGMLTEWNSRRQMRGRPIQDGTKDISGVLRKAANDGYEWALVDTSSMQISTTIAAIPRSTLVLIPARPCELDLPAVQETIYAARDRRSPYVVVLNAAPAKRCCTEDPPTVACARAQLKKISVPVWPGQISQRAVYPISLAIGGTATEIAPESAACAEVADLWTAVIRLSAAINETKAKMSRQAGRSRVSIGVVSRSSLGPMDAETAPAVKHSY